MGKKAKSSRKGKKAWRANISTEDIDEYFEKSTKDALSGGSLTNVPSESLFFVDKSRDLSVKRKIEKHREKVLYCDSLLQRNSFVQPVPSSTQKKSKKRGKEVPKAKDDVQGRLKEEGVSNSGMVDIWDGKGEHTGKTKKKSKPSVIPAVEVEPPGCSFNPSFESHQDSLARAVADEMQKIYRHELGPEPVPLTVPGEVVDEEEMYFLDADNGSDDDDPNIANEDKDGDNEHENSLPDIIQEIAKEDEERQKRHLRRAVAKQERLKSRPPHLGKHKFEPAPVQVLLSEEISGSLRKLKGCSTLARDRFKSLEKRGLIVPTAKSGSFMAKSSLMCRILRSYRYYRAVCCCLNERSMEEEAERKIGWFLKLLFFGTGTVVAYQFLPYMGDNLMQQSVSLLHVKDPLFKRMGASRLTHFAIDDERRMKIVEMGGAEKLLNMLGAAEDDRTRKEALKALVALSPSDEATRFLHRAGAISVIRSTPNSSEDAEIEKYKLSLLNRFQDLRFDVSS
ncbi:hypothetical protein CsSME_00028769 [Camellia sinensis var. sinensis]